MRACVGDQDEGSRVRIISDFKDYYDSALSFGIDPNLLYVRNQEQFEFPGQVGEKKGFMPRGLDQALRIPLEYLRALPHLVVDAKVSPAWYPEMPITAKIYGFCGFLYGALEINGTTYFATDQLSATVAPAFLAKCGLDPDGLERLLRQRLRYRFYDQFERPKPLTHDFWKRCVADFRGKRFDEVFVDARVPVFRLDYVALNKRGCPDTIRCTLNPYLRPDAFQKIKSPAQAFQELSMYLGNQLARQLDPTQIVPDDVLRDEKGFDQWSFRRHREDGKKYRKRNSP